MSFAELLSYISTLTVFVPFFYCVPAIKRKDKFLLSLLLLLCISIIISIISEIYVQTGSKIYIQCFNLYTLFEFVGISFVYGFLMPHLRKWTYLSMVLFVLYFLINCYWIESINSIQDDPLVVESIIVIVYCSFYFLHSLKNVSHDYSLFNDGKFWINIAFLSYFVYNIGLFAVANHILTQLEPATTLALWNIHNTNYIIKNILLAIGIYRISNISRPPFELFGADENWWQRLPHNPTNDISAQKPR